MHPLRGVLQHLVPVVTLLSFPLVLRFSATLISPALRAFSVAVSFASAILFYVAFQLLVQPGHQVPLQ